MTQQDPLPDTALVPVTRRYRRTLGLAWWGALLLVPAVLAALGSATSGTSASPGTGGAVTTSAATSGSAGSPSVVATAVGPEPVPSPFTVSLTDTTATIVATAPSEAAKSTLLATVAQLAPSLKVVDKVTVTDGAVAPSATALAPISVAASKITGFTEKFDGKTFTFTGTATEKNALAAALPVLSQAFADTTTADRTVLGSGGGTLDAGSLTCDNLGSSLKAAMAKAPIRFGTAGAALTAESARAVTTIAGVAKGCPNAVLTVTGYTDSQGTPERNLALSVRRATAVKAALAQAGMPSARIVTVGAGQANPVASNTTPAGMAANRRVEITLKEGAR